MESIISRLKKCMELLDKSKKDLLEVGRSAIEEVVDIHIIEKKI